ncbi:MAG: amidohydrolase [Oscillospiraceae bacterium]|nr:amidohydrolase [Oscillospiraceae bacterium]
MKIIDSHMHFSDIATFKHSAYICSELDYSEKGHQNEARENGVVHSICMGLSEIPPDLFPSGDAKTPMLADLTEKLPPDMSLCLGINPHTLTEKSLGEMEEMITGKCGVVGIKIYAGYYHFDVSDPVYDPVYKLAEKHDIAVAIHCGDTYSEKGLLVYAHPLTVDRLAVNHPDLRIVICHIGTPWIFDACEVTAKNKNVYVDTSGLLVGNREFVAKAAANPLVVDRYRSALTYLERYDKVIFGTDWPLAAMDEYIGFCKRLVPQEAHGMFFYENAVKVYRCC